MNPAMEFGDLADGTGAVLGFAAVGALAGTIVPVVGTLIGALLGGLTGMFFGPSDAEVAVKVWNRVCPQLDAAVNRAVGILDAKHAAALTSASASFDDRIQLYQSKLEEADRVIAQRAAELKERRLAIARATAELGRAQERIAVVPA